MNLPLLHRLSRRVVSTSADPSSSLTLRSTARSHVGLVRKINEDRAFECSEHSLWAVADGMGGHRGGDLAAASVIEALRHLVDRDDSLCAYTVAAALHDANRAIFSRNQRDGADAGTTVVAAFADQGIMTIFWAGDSRAYLIRDDTLELRSKDHSVVQDLVDAGLITAAAAANHPQANIVTRALGVTSEVVIDRAHFDLRAGDRVVLCSDGLSRSIRPEDLTIADPDIDATADRLIECALSRDGSDNTTMVIIHAT